MGYDLHITCAVNWFDSQEIPITADEWLAYVTKDPELIIDLRDNGPHFALWLDHWRDGDYPWFNWRRGAIYTKNPDQKTLGKMLKLAKDFGAKVQGDEGEEYACPEDLGHPNHPS
jgi:hypothetical protein